jgi:hypothetical protein
MSWRCRHRWTPRATSLYGYGTYVLMVCTACGQPKTQYLAGHWSLEDLAVASDDALKQLQGERR